MRAHLRKNRIPGGGTRLYQGIARRATYWWLRSPNTNNTNNVWNVNSNGNYGTPNANNTYGVRPALMEKRVRVTHMGESRVSIIKGGYILSTIPRGMVDEYIVPMPGSYGITDCLYGAIWRHTITALRGRGRPLLRDGGRPQIYNGKYI